MCISQPFHLDRNIALALFEQTLNEAQQLVFGIPVTVLFIMGGICLIAGFLRGLAGFGAGMVMVPSFAILVGSVMAVPLMQLIDMIGQAPVTIRTWRQIPWRAVLYLVAPALIFTPIGVMMLTAISQQAFLIGIGLFILLAVIVLLSGWRYRGPQHPALLLALGSIAGFLSGFVAVSGPIIVVFAFALPGSAHQARAMIVGYFALQTLIAVIFFAIAGLINWQVLLVAVLLVVPYALAVAIGSMIAPRVREKPMRLLAYTIVSVMAALALWSGWRG